MRQPQRVTKQHGKALGYRDLDLACGNNRDDDEANARLTVVKREIDNLAANILLGVARSTLLNMLGEREVEKARLETALASRLTAPPGATVLPHPALLRLLQQKIGALRDALDQDAVRGEASTILATLIESVTIYPDGDNGPEAEVVAKVADLLAFATNDDAAPKGGVSNSITVVAGTGFGRCRTRFQLQNGTILPSR